MNESPDTTLGVLVGHEIAARRRLLRLTLRELAARAGVSQPFLSQLERGLSMPSMTTIYSLARALEVAPGDLLPVPARQPTAVRAHEGQRLSITDSSPESGIRALLLTNALPLTVLEYTISPEEQIVDWYQTAGDSGLFILEGALKVSIQDGPTFTLEADDFLHLPAGIKDRWALASPEAARVLFVISVPSGEERASASSSLVPILHTQGADPQR